MDFILPEENELIDAIYSLGCDIFEYNDSRLFLLDNIKEKKIINRLISYLICLKIIPSQRNKWGTYLYKNINHYFQRVRFYFDKNPLEPLQSLPIKYESLLKNDLVRTIRWFEKIALEIGIKESFISEGLFRISRIFSIIILENPDISYTQGFDRFGCIFFALTSLFCQLTNLSLEVAESLTYYLTFSLLSILPMRSLLDNPLEVHEHFKKLDNILLNYSNIHHSWLHKNNSEIIFFGVRWELLLFSDEHNINDIFLIWDQILGRLESLNEIIISFSISHLIQFSTKINENINEYILHNKEWDILKIINDMKKILFYKRGFKEEFCFICCPCLPKYHGFEF